MVGTGEAGIQPRPFLTEPSAVEDSLQSVRGRTRFSGQKPTIALDTSDAARSDAYAPTLRVSRR